MRTQAKSEEISNFRFEMALLTCCEAVEFLRVGATACLARPYNTCENVAYVRRRNAIQHSPRSFAVVNTHDVNRAI